MQLPIGGAHALDAAPEKTPAPPRVPEKGSKRARIWWWLLAVLIVAVATGLYLQRQRSLQAEQKRIAGPLFRSFTVAPATVIRSLRLSGATAAERYSSLLTPQLRGRRSGGGGDSSTGAAAPDQLPKAIASNSGVSNSSSASPSPGSASSGNSAQIGASRGFSTKNAYQAATTRGGGSSASSSGSTQSSADPTSGAASLGSTAGNLLRTGGGGGSSDWTLNLQQVVKPGAIVKPGEVVAEFDRQYMLLRLDDYRAAVLQDENSLKSLKATLEVTSKAHEQSIRSAKAEVDKAKLDVKTIPVRSAIDSEKLRLALEEAEARYRQVLSEVKFVEASARAQIRDREIELQQTTIEYKRASANAEQMLVKAPIGGLTVMQSLFRGGEMQQIRAGDQLWPGMMFMQVVDNRSMVVNAVINQVDIESIRLGQKAVVRFDAYPDLELPAHVVSIAAMTKTGGMRQSFVKSIPVRLKLDQVEPRVIPDLTVSAEVQLDSVNVQAAVPLEAVFRDSQDGRPFVFVREAAGWKRRDLVLGLTSNLAGAVQSGLAPGEIVALQRPTDETTADKDPSPEKSTKE